LAAGLENYFNREGLDGLAALVALDLGKNSWRDGLGLSHPCRQDGQAQDHRTEWTQQLPNHQTPSFMFQPVVRQIALQDSRVSGAARLPRLS
jgi:hypothetical protein